MKLKNVINKHKSNKIKENSNTVRHLNNGTDHRHSKSCCDQSSPARRTITKSSWLHTGIGMALLGGSSVDPSHFWDLHTVPEAAHGFEHKLNGCIHYGTPRDWLILVTFRWIPCFMASVCSHNFHAFIDKPLIAMSSNLMGELVMRLVQAWFTFR